MKKLLFIAALFYSGICFGQNTHLQPNTFTNDSLAQSWTSAKVAVPWNTFRVKRTSLNGVDTLKGYGDSYMTGFNGYATYATRCDAAIIANRFNLTLANYGVGGMGAFTAAKAGSLNINPASNNSVSYIRFGFNDYKRSGVNLATNKKIASCLSSLIASNLIDSIYSGCIQCEGCIHIDP